jgi:hypothetical protein
MKLVMIEKIQANDKNRLADSPNSVNLFFKEFSMYRVSVEI